MNAFKGLLDVVVHLLVPISLCVIGVVIPVVALAPFDTGIGSTVVAKLIGSTQRQIGADGMSKADTELPRSTELILQFVVTGILVSKILTIQTQTCLIDRTQVVEDGRVDVESEAER